MSNTTPHPLPTLNPYQKAFDRCTPEQQAIIVQEFERTPKRFLSVEALAYDVLKYGSFEALQTVRQKQLEAALKVKEARDKSLALPDYVYIYRSMVNGRLMYTFLLEPDKQHGYELYRYLWADTGARRLVKDLRHEFSGRKHGEFYSLSKRQAQELLEIPSGTPLYDSPIAPIVPKQFVEKPKRVLEKSGYVYLLKEVNGAHYKIGQTSNPEQRKQNFDVKLPFAVEFEVLIETNNRYELERQLHQRFAHKREKGEWFKLSPEDVEYIQKLGIGGE